MFFNNKNKIFRNLKSSLKDLQKVESDIKQKKFETALAEVKLGFSELKMFLNWLRKQSNKSDIDTKFVYGMENIDDQINKINSLLMDLKVNYNQNDYDKALQIVQRIEKYIFWELKSDKRFTKQNSDLIQKSHEDVLKQIRFADKKLFAIIDKYNLADPVDFIHFENKEFEKNKFFTALKAGQVYNPVFTYKSIPQNLLSQIENLADDVMTQLRSLKLPKTNGASYIVEKKRINLQIILKLIRSIGTNKVTTYSIKLYGFPTDDMIRNAFNDLKEEKKFIEENLDSKLNEPRYSVEEFKQKTDSFIRTKRMNWTTIIKTNEDMSGRFKTDNTKRELWVNKDVAPFSEKDILKAIEHELNVHAYRYEMGRKSPLKILAFGTSGYLPTEEGLTTYFEDLKNVKNSLLEKKKILYVITESLASKSSFYDCFTTLVEHRISPDIAWDVVVRVKRGLGDTSKKGGFFKDHVYYLGDDLLKEFIASGGSAKDLLGGKIGLNDAKNLIGKYKL